MIRIILIALAVVILTLVLLPFQLIGLAFELRLQRTIPHWYHRVLCALIGVRIREVGRRSTASPTLILSNHVSWLDICVITALRRWCSSPRARSRDGRCSAGSQNC